MTAAPPAPRSPAQIEASRRNGAKSRGPVTPEGRRRAAMNAMKRGLTADSFTLAPEEDEAGFDELVARLEARFAPGDEAAGHPVQRLASVMWRPYRGDRIEAEVLAQRERRHDSAFSDGYVPRSPLAWDAGRFNAVQRYQARLDRMLFRLLEALDGHTAQGTATAPADTGKTQEEKFPNEPCPIRLWQKAVAARGRASGSGRGRRGRSGCRCRRRWRRHPGRSRRAARAAGWRG